MAADLDDWIDEPIEVEFVTREEGQQTRYTLEGADEKGVVLGCLDERNLGEYRMLFFPWHRIRRVNLLTPKWPDAPEGRSSEGE